MYFSSIFTAVHFQTFKTLFVWEKKKKNRIVSLKTITFLRWLLLPILFLNKIYYVLFYIKTIGTIYLMSLLANDTNLINKINQKESPFATNTFITIIFPLYHNITTNNDNYDTSNLTRYTYTYLFIYLIHTFLSQLIISFSHIRINITFLETH